MDEKGDNEMRFPDGSPSTMDDHEKKMKSSFVSDASTETKGGGSKIAGVFQRCCTARMRDCSTICWQVCICCPCFVLVSVLVLGIAFLISFLTGRGILREKFSSFSIEKNRFITQHTQHAKLGVYSLSETSVIKNYLCSMENITEQQTELDEFLYQYVKYNYLFLHHVRVIDFTGEEVSRIDLEHNDTAIIAKNKFNVQGTCYHQDFLDGKSYSDSFFGEWKTHGPLKYGEYYEYIGDDLTGDHQEDHIEYLPLPQILRVQKSVMCNSTFSGGYVIFNIRMVVLLKDIDATNELYTLIIVNEDGDYLFYNQKRDKEFQSKLNKEQTISKDWGIGSGSIMKKFYEFEEEEFSIGLNEFLCSTITLSEHQYHLCVVVSSLNSLLESPVPMVVGIVFNIIFLGVLLCCYFNCQIKKQSRKYEKLVGALYPKEISKPLLRGKKVVARYQTDLVIMFADIVSFVHFNESFHNDPNILVVVLGNIIDVVDSMAEIYGVHKIKTIGYFGCCGLSFKKRKKDEQQRRENKKNVINLLKFANLIIRYFKQRQISIGGKMLECPDWRIGVSFGGAVSGILNLKTPYFDLWGKSVNLAARMESNGQPGRVHVSRRVYELIQDCFHLFEYEENQEVMIKGFGLTSTCFVNYKKYKNMDKIIRRLSKGKLKKMRSLFKKKKGVGIGERTSTLTNLEHSRVMSNSSMLEEDNDDDDVRESSSYFSNEERIVDFEEKEYVDNSSTVNSSFEEEHYIKKGGTIVLQQPNSITKIIVSSSDDDGGEEEEEEEEGEEKEEMEGEDVKSSTMSTLESEDIQ